MRFMLRMFWESSPVADSASEERGNFDANRRTVGVLLLNLLHDDNARTGGGEGARYL